MRQIALVVTLDEWTRPRSPASSASPVSWAGYCYTVYANTPPANRNRWVLSVYSYMSIQAECMLASRGRADPFDPARGQPVLFGIPVEIRDGDGLPHLE